MHAFDMRLDYILHSDDMAPRAPAEASAPGNELQLLYKPISFSCFTNQQTSNPRPSNLNHKP